MSAASPGMHTDEAGFAQELRKGSCSTWEALVVGAVGAAAYVLAAYVLTLTLSSFWRPLANKLIPLAIASVVAALLPRTRGGAAMVSALVAPASVVVAAFLVVGAPYIRQSLGLSHLAGHALLVLIPSLACLAGFALLRARSTSG